MTPPISSYMVVPQVLLICPLFFTCLLSKSSSVGYTGLNKQCLCLVLLAFFKCHQSGLNLYVFFDQNTSKKHMPYGFLSDVNHYYLLGRLEK